MDISVSNSIKQALSPYKFKLELHAHTSPASGCSDISPEQLVQTYKRLGYDAVAITNHFIADNFLDNVEEKLDRYLDDFDRAFREGKRLGIKVILGAEIRFLENCNDYLLYGIDREELLRAAGFFASAGVEEFYKGFKTEKNLFIQAHPLRNGMEYVPASSLDGIEAFNMHPNHNSRVALAAKRAREEGLIMLAGTDYHHVGHEGLAALMTRTLPENSYQLAEILKSSDYVMNIGGCTVVNI